MIKRLPTHCNDETCSSAVVAGDSIRGYDPSFNVSVVDFTTTEKSEWIPPNVEAGASRF